MVSFFPFSPFLGNSSATDSIEVPCRFASRQGAGKLQGRPTAGRARAFGTSLVRGCNPPPLSRLDCRRRKPAQVAKPIIADLYS